jgi:hypothetical protein
MALAAVGYAHQKLRAEVERFIAALQAHPSLKEDAAPVVLNMVRQSTAVFELFRELGPDEARASWRSIAHVLLRPGTKWEDVDTPEENREGSASELLVTEVLNEPVSIIDDAADKPWILQCVPFVGIVPAEAFYFPAAEAPRRAAEFTPEAVLALVEWAAPPPPVRVDHKPGRNDPCPCGSGKKAKHCCG